MDRNQRTREWLRSHFERYRQRTAWAFCWRISIESTVVSLVAVLVLSLFIPVQRRMLLDWPLYQVVLFTVCFAPILETCLFQVIPIGLARLVKAGFLWQVFVSLLVFSVPHFTEGIAVGVGAGVIGGFYFAFTYAHWRERSRWTAIWTTALCHAIHNGIAILFILPNWFIGRT